MNGAKNAAKSGQIIQWNDKDRPIVPDKPILPFIVGDGIGPDIWKATQPVLNAAVEKAFQGKKQIIWVEILAGEKARLAYGEKKALPEETLASISHYGIAIKGPLTTPVGGGFRSLNVALRQALDLYACVRPVRYFSGVPSPVRNPEKLDVIIFRENTEDVYSGLEWPAGCYEARQMLKTVNRETQKAGGTPISLESAVGIKPMSEFKTNRLVAKAIQYAIVNNRESVTLVHKGNIMKYTEGAFRDWGYKLAHEQFSANTITEQEVLDRFDGKRPSDRVVIKDRLADSMFQQLLLRPQEYHVIATPNLNGDYLSDAAAAQVGGLGMAPGANIGDRCALFEATHGTAPKYAGLDKVNPSSLILSGAEMLRFMGWGKATDIIISALLVTIEQKTVTYDLARQMEDAKEVRCSAFAQAIVDNMAEF